MASRFSVEAVFKAVDKVTAPVTRMQNRLQKFTRSLNRSIRSANKSLSTLTGGFAHLGKTMFKVGAVGAASLGAGLGFVIHQFSKIEDAQAAFTPLLGGADKAADLVDRLNKTAASTPFQFDNLSVATKQLLPAMNGDLDLTVKTLRMLGDTAGGNAQKLETIARAFGRIKLQSTATLEDINMIGDTGVPMLKELQKTIGAGSIEQTKKLISAGRVTAEQVTKTFERMTSKGGIFFRGMEIASKTTTGLFSTLVDNVGQTAAAIGKQLAPTVKKLIVSLTEVAQKVKKWVEAHQDLIKTRFEHFVKVITTGLKKFIDRLVEINKTTPILEKVMTFLKIIGKAFLFIVDHAKAITIVVGAFLSLAAVLKVVQISMAVLSAIMALNPMGLMVLTIAAIVGGLILLVKHWDQVVAALQSGAQFVTDFIVEAWEGMIHSIGGAMFDLVNSVKDLWMSMWDTVKSVFTSGIDWVNKQIDDAVKMITDIPGQISKATSGLANSALNLIGLGDDEDTVQTPAAQVVSPQERVARSIQETNNTTKSEVTIRDETGRAEVTSGSLDNSLVLLNAGGF